MLPRLMALVPLAALFAQPVPQLRDLASGIFLVASRDLRDPNFSETVVLLAQYGKTGAMGVIMNRPAEVPLSRLFPSIPKKAGEANLYAGGPVGRNGALGLLRSKSKPGGEAQPVLEDVYLVTEREMLEKALSAGASESVRVYVGYAGWSPGQLEMEVAAGAWHIVAATAALAFDPETETLWRRMVRRANSRIARSRFPLLEVPVPGDYLGCGRRNHFSRPGQPI
jgi:putative transcriptional regulator